jgi:hypothetical protein
MPTASNSRIQWLKSFDRVTIHNQRDEKNRHLSRQRCGAGGIGRRSRRPPARPRRWPPGGAPPPASSSATSPPLPPPSPPMPPPLDLRTHPVSRPESNQHHRIERNRSRMLTSPRRLARTERRRYLRRSESAGREQAGADADLTHPTPARGTRGAGGGAGGGGSSPRFILSLGSGGLPPRSGQFVIYALSLITITC